MTRPASRTSTIRKGPGLAPRLRISTVPARLRQAGTPGAAGKATAIPAAREVCGNDRKVVQTGEQ